MHNAQAFPAHPDDDETVAFPDHTQAFGSSAGSGDYGFEGNGVVLPERTARSSSAHLLEHDSDEEDETDFDLDRAFSGQQEVEELNMDDLAQLGARVKRDTMSDSSSGGAKGAWGRVRELAFNTLLRAHPTCTRVCVRRTASRNCPSRLS